MSIEKKAELLDKALSYKFMVLWCIAVVAVSVVSMAIVVKYWAHAPMILLLCHVVLLFISYMVTLKVAVKRAPELGLQIAAPFATIVCMAPAVSALRVLVYTLIDMDASAGVILSVVMIGSMIITFVCCRACTKIEARDKSLSTYKEIKEILDNSEISTETREELLRVALS